MARAWDIQHLLLGHIMSALVEAPPRKKQISLAPLVLPWGAWCLSSPLVAGAPLQRLRAPLEHDSPGAAWHIITLPATTGSHKTASSHFALISRQYLHLMRGGWFRGGDGDGGPQIFVSTSKMCRQEHLLKLLKSDRGQSPKLNYTK